MNQNLGSQRIFNSLAGHASAEILLLPPVTTDEVKTLMAAVMLTSLKNHNFSYAIERVIDAYGDDWGRLLTDRVVEMLDQLGHLNYALKYEDVNDLDFATYTIGDAKHVCIRREHLKELNAVLMACRTDGDHTERLEAIALEIQCVVDWIEEGN